MVTGYTKVINIIKDFITYSIMIWKPHPWQRQAEKIGWRRKVLYQTLEQATKSQRGLNA